MLFFPYKSLREWLQHISNQHLVKILLNVWLGSKAGMPQGLMSKGQGGFLDVGRGYVQVCYRIKTPCIQHKKLPQIQGVCLCQWPLAKSWICQNKLWKANAPIWIDNLLFFFFSHFSNAQILSKSYCDNPTTVSNSKYFHGSKETWGKRLDSSSLYPWGNHIIWCFQQNELLNCINVFSLSCTNWKSPSYCLLYLKLMLMPSEKQQKRNVDSFPVAHW